MIDKVRSMAIWLSMDGGRYWPDVMARRIAWEDDNEKKAGKEGRQRRGLRAPVAALLRLPREIFAPH
jgi:hypothetical protein